LGQPGTLFGITEAELADFGTTYGFAGLILFMLFIIGQLAYSSKAGKLGTFALFFVLAFGMFGFVAKFIIQAFWGI
jgi:hypothetical protein